MLFSLLSVSSILSFNMVGWYLGNQSGISNIQFDKLTHVVTGFPNQFSNGTVLCNKNDTTTQEIIQRAHRTNTKVQWRFSMPNLTDYMFNNQAQDIKTNYFNSIDKAMNDCNIDGVELDFEWSDTPFHLGFIPPRAANTYTEFLVDLKNTLNNKIVSADIGIWGMFPQAYIIGYLPWLNVSLFNDSPIDFVNVMSYHWADTIEPWFKDAIVLKKIWGFNLTKVNLAVPYYNMNYSFFPFRRSEPLWRDLSPLCPNIDPSLNVCENVRFIGKDLNYALGKAIVEMGFGGIFPWAIDYDSFEYNNTLFNWLYKGTIS